MPSTVIHHFEYDAASGALEITFVNGRHYVYRDVPAAIVDGMRRARSKGGFFNRRIRDQFRFERLADSDVEARAR